MASRHFRSCKARPSASLLRKMRRSRASPVAVGGGGSLPRYCRGRLFPTPILVQARRRQAPYSGGPRGTNNGRCTNGSAAAILDRRRRYRWRDAACDCRALRDPVLRLFEAPLGLVSIVTNLITSRLNTPAAGQADFSRSPLVGRDHAFRYL